MAEIEFYAKPGCISNTRQKQLLREAGHTVKEKNLLTEPWTAAKLLAFLHDLPVQAWFNINAPQIKSGEVDPDVLSAEQAIHCLLQEPLLIRRPLIEVMGQKLVGFDPESLKNIIPLKNDIRISDDWEACSVESS